MPPPVWEILDPPLVLYLELVTKKQIVRSSDFTKLWNLCFSQLPDDYLRENSYEEFDISFKTRQPDGLIWFAGNQERNLHLSLQV